jgi:hypothetical protein
MVETTTFDTLAETAGNPDRTLNIANDSFVDGIDEDRVVEITDEALEAAATDPMVTFTLSVAIFACRFC